MKIIGKIISVHTTEKNKYLIVLENEQGHKFEVLYKTEYGLYLYPGQVVSGYAEQFELLMNPKHISGSRLVYPICTYMSEVTIPVEVPAPGSPPPATSEEAF